MLSGVNAKCRKCRGECKQWKQVTVVVCPNFVANWEHREVTTHTETPNLTKVER